MVQRIVMVRLALADPHYLSTSPSGRKNEESDPAQIGIQLTPARITDCWALDFPSNGVSNTSIKPTRTRSSSQHVSLSG
jgi:hypothetical protein